MSGITDRERISNGEDPLHGDPMDLCSMVLSVVCDHCPEHDGKCMKDDDGFFNTNHDQMVQCLKHYAERVDGIFPKPEEIEDPEGECTGSCEEVGCALLDMICQPCPHFLGGGACMPWFGELQDQDTINYNQLCECFSDMVLRLMKVYPKQIKHPWEGQK